VYELHWVKITRDSDVTFVGALYHPPAPLYKTSDLLDRIEAAVLKIQQDFPGAHIILAGDLNTLSDSDVIIRTGLMSLVTQPTRGANRLDRLYVSDFQYDGVKVVIPLRSKPITEPSSLTLAPRGRTPTRRVVCVHFESIQLICMQIF